MIDMPNPNRHMTFRPDSPCRKGAFADHRVVAVLAHETASSEVVLEGQPVT